MKSKVSSVQIGQALIEAIFMLMILIILLFAIQFSGRMRSYSIDLIGDSSFRSFIQTKNKNSNKNDSNEIHSIKKSMTHQLEEQVLDVHSQGLIKTSVSQPRIPYARSAANRLFAFQPMQRSSYLLINAGESGSDQEVLRRIERSDAAWRNTTVQTQKIIISHGVQLARADIPWSREKIQTDWLSRWSNLVPRMLNKREIQ